MKQITYPNSGRKGEVHTTSHWKLDQVSKLSLLLLLSFSPLRGIERGIKGEG